MAINNDDENKQEGTDIELTDIEIAELANAELKKKDNEINSLKKELAKTKLYSTAEKEEGEKRTKEDCIKVITGRNTNNYDYAQAVVDLVDIETAAGNPNPLGQDGDKVYSFLKDCIDECDGQKDKFNSVYQLKIGDDSPEVALAWKRRNKK